MKNNIKSFSFRKLLYNKRITVPLSVAISFVLWIIITVNQKPTSQRVFSDMTVAINMENTFAAENEMKIVGDISDQRFTVHVMGPNHIVNALTAKDINLYASAAEVDSPGEYKIAVSAAKASTNADYDILSITPKTVKVNFDYIETREFVLEASAEGVTAAKGLIAEAPTVGGIEGGKLKVTGPRTVLNKIESVKAEAVVNKTLSESQTFDAGINFYNSKGKAIKADNLEYTVDKLKVTVPISKKKTVPVKVDFSNTPKGFKKSSLSCSIDHARVTIIGTPQAVEKTDSITLSPIDISTLSRTKTEFSVEAKLPDGIRLLDAIEMFTVKVNLSGYYETTVNVNRIKYTGLGKGLKTSNTAAIKNVRICGPADVIYNLSDEKIFAEINLKDKKAGEHAVSVVIGFDDYKNLWAIGTYETSVTIK